MFVLVFGSFRPPRFVPKSAMTDSPASVSDVSPASQGHGAEQNHRNSQRRGRFWPFDWRGDGNCTQSDKHIENPDEILAAFFVLIEPGLSILVRHGEHAVVSLLSEFVNGPRRRGADEHKRQRCDLSLAALQNQSEHKSDQTCEESVNRQRIEHHMNVFWLLQIAQQSPYHNLPCHWVPQTCAVRAAWFGKYFCQLAMVKCHHSVRNPQNPAFRIAICSKCTCARISA